MRSFLGFSLASILFTAISLGFGFAALDSGSAWQGVYAASLALIPMLATVAVVLLVARTDPHDQLLIGLGVGGVRMFLVLALALLLSQTNKETFGTAFLLWLLVFYLVFLAFEIGFLLARQGPSNGSKSGGRSFDS